MDRITFLGFNKKLRFTISHGATTDLQFTLPAPKKVDYKKTKKKYKYLAESWKNKSVTQYVLESFEIQYEPNQLTTTQLGYLESMDTYSDLQAYTIKVKPDTTNSWEPEIIVDEIRYEYHADQHRLVRTIINITVKDATVLTGYNLI